MDAEDSRPPGLGDLWFAMIGSVSVAFESQISYLRHRLEQADAADRDDPLLDTLIESHRLHVDLFRRMFDRRGVDPAFVRRYVRVSGQAVRQFAEEGRAVMRALADATRNTPRGL